MELKTVIITQARFGSSRLPGKVMLKASGKSFLEIHTSRIKQSVLANEVIIATSLNDADNVIADEAKLLHIKCSRGSEQDVLARYFYAAKDSGADIIVRVTSDCPFADPVLIDEMLQHFFDGKYDYLSNTFEYSFPDGIDVEIMSFTALEKAFYEADLPSEREHVTPYIRKNSDLEGGNLFKAFNFRNPVTLPEITRLTLDEPADQQVLTLLVEKLGTGKPWRAYHDYLIEHPEIKQLNSYISINEGYDKSLKQDGANK